jgi:peptide-N4-(N-acetyl-beta-glucosaminyl)asparagine amidase
LTVSEPQHQGLNQFTKEHSGVKSVHQVRKIAKTSAQDTEIILLSCSRGLITGRLSGTPSYMRLPGCQDFQALFTVYLKGQLEPGDCGCWVVDADSGDLFGHIVAGSPLSGIGYIVPSTHVFADIRDQLGDCVELPTHEESKIIEPILERSHSIDQNELDLVDQFRRILINRQMNTSGEVQFTSKQTSKESSQFSPAASNLTTPDQTFFSEESEPPAYEALDSRRSLPLVPVPPTDSSSIRFRNMLHTLSNMPLKWENPGLLDEALRVVPLQRIYDEAEDESQTLQTEAKGQGSHMKAAWGYQDCVIRSLMRWFKLSFFSWVNQPPCSVCGRPTTGVGMAAPTPDENARGASQVELYRCSYELCSNYERFPRYNDAFVLLETRRGRVGEWSNCFGMLCRAMGARVRWMWCSEDHVWIEIYSTYRRRWVPVDVCEQEWDKKRLYTEGNFFASYCPNIASLLTYAFIGWQRKIAYCIAFSVDGATDVTPRYVRNFSKWGARRDRTTEAVLVYILAEIRALRRKAMSVKEKFVLQGEDIRENRELRSHIAKALAEELCKSVFTDKGVLTSTDPNSCKALEARSAETRKLESNESRPIEDSESQDL